MRKFYAIAIVGALMLSSCAKFREWRAEHHQPFKPHKEKKMKHKRHRK